MDNLNIAIISPSQNAYSETFIQASRQLLKGKKFYYYGGEIPSSLNDGSLRISSLFRVINKIKRILSFTELNSEEEIFFKSLKSNNIQVVLAHYGTTAHKIKKICEKASIPLVVHFHGFDASTYSVIKNCNNYSEVFQYTSKVIAVSQVMKQKLIELGCSEDKIVLNPYGSNDSFFNIKASFSKPQFIAVGRFVNKKAPYLTILAFKKVIEKYPEMKLIMGGDGMLLETCKNIVNYYGLGDNIIFKGIISPDEYINYLSNSLAFIQHSVTAENGDMEGTPVAVLEASAAGVPIISTIHAGIPDVIINGETGLLSKEHDVEQMSINILRVIENPELAKEMGRKGRENIKNNFSMDRYINNLQKALIDSIKMK